MADSRGTGTPLRVRSMKPGNIPTARIAPILEALIRDRWPYSDEDVLSCSELASGYAILADKTGCDPTTIVKIVRQEYEGADFDLVDRLFCALGRPDVWRGELLDVYEAMEFVQKCSLHSCNKTFPETNSNGNRQKYCSSRCRILHADVRKGIRTGERLRAKNRCLRGHLLTPDNVKLSRRGDGSTFRRCRTCKKAQEREAYRARHSTPVERQRVTA